MKHLILPATAIALLLSGCRDEVKKQADKQQADTVTSAPSPKKPGNNALSFESPVRITNSDYVMYPLAIKTDEKGGFIKSSGRNPGQFWNYAFYNTATGEYHLLDKSRKMLISANDVSVPEDVNLSPGKTVFTDSLIFYSVRTVDYNDDGELTNDDPDYLFVSDKNGRNFRQVSPANSDVIGWQAEKNTGKLLMLAMADTNSDKIFNSDDDKVTPYVYDLKTGKLAAVFSEDFITTTDKLFKKHWAAKK